MWRHWLTLTLTYMGASFVAWMLLYLLSGQDLAASDLIPTPITEVVIFTVFHCAVLRGLLAGATGLVVAWLLSRGARPRVILAVAMGVPAATEAVIAVFDIQHIIAEGRLPARVIRDLGVGEVITVLLALSAGALVGRVALRRAKARASAIHASPNWRSRTYALLRIGTALMLAGGVVWAVYLRGLTRHGIRRGMAELYWFGSTERFRAITLMVLGAACLAAAAFTCVLALRAARREARAASRLP